MGIASSGKFIMTCSNKTDMVIWDLKGEKLAKLDTFLMSTTCAKISPCGRFVVASGKNKFRFYKSILTMYLKTNLTLKGQFLNCTDLLLKFTGITLMITF